MKKDFARHNRNNPVVGVLLLNIAIILLVITAPLGFIFGVLFNLPSFKKIGDFCLKVAISVDQLGNVIMQHLLNISLIVKGGYRFGNRDETISSVIGKNKTNGTLSFLGRFLDTILEIIESKHSLNSIDYYIEPETDAIKH